jgi:hypothetical protein
MRPRIGHDREVTRRSQARVVAVIVVLFVVGVAIRSAIPSRTVGHGAVEEACFAFSRAVQLPNGESAYAVFERARDAATRSADPTLAADVVHAVSKYGEDGTGAPLSRQVVDGALAQCTADGWATTDPCTYGAPVCTGTTTTRS